MYNPHTALTALQAQTAANTVQPEAICTLTTPLLSDHPSGTVRMCCVVVFNLFDLTGNGRIDRDKLKRMSVALMTSPTAAAPSPVDPSKEFAPLLDLFAFFALHSFDRDADRQLAWMEWRLYAEDDERIRRMVDEMSSRRARRKEREARHPTQPQKGGNHSQQPLTGSKGGAALLPAGGKKEGGEADGGGVDGDERRLSSEVEADDDDEVDVDAVQALAWSEWMGAAVGDESEWSSRLPTPDSRLPTPDSRSCPHDLLGHR